MPDTPRRRMMGSVLHGFLGTFVSRYSDFRGYWLLGQLEPLLEGWEVDLLDPTSGHAASRADIYARRWASQRLWEQVSKHGLSRGAVCAASVRVSSVGPMREEWTGERTRRGRDFVFQATATVDTGKVFSAQRSVFVAPHDPKFERGRAGHDSGGVIGSGPIRCVATVLRLVDHLLSTLRERL